MRYFVCVGIWCLVFAACLWAKNHKADFREQIKSYHDSNEFPCTIITITNSKHEVIFNDCNSLQEARAWLNYPGRATFINLGDTEIINVDHIIKIDPKYKIYDWNN